jgi:hypothetical protein
MPKPQEPEFNYEELELPATHNHVMQQRVSRRVMLIPYFHSPQLILSTKVNFDKLTAPARQDLEEKYPLDNHPLFPGKCIYSDKKTGSHWELTVIHLNVWATHLVWNKFGIFYMIFSLIPSIGM